MTLSEADPTSVGGYRLVGRLGSGGMGVVYRGQSDSGRQVAVKLVHQQFADETEFRVRFRQEVDAVRRVSGAFTAAVMDADPDAPHPWMATSYVTGPTLAQRVTEDGPLGSAELCTLLIGLAEALRDIHRAGVVHRDLKPANVILSGEGPRVIDFGISRAADRQHMTTTGRVMGTPPFMSPEQFRAPKDVGPESDVFSLGAVLVYAACGRSPFEADSPYVTAYRVVHEPPDLGALPAPFHEVVTDCLDKSPSKRPSVTELLTWSREFTAGRSAAPAATSVPDSGTHRSRRRRALITAATIAAAMGAGIAALLASGLPEGTRDSPEKAPRASSPAAGSRAWREARPKIAPGVALASQSYPRHAAALAFDGLDYTWWGTGVSGVGQGQWIEARFPQPVRLQDLIITPGTSPQATRLPASARPHRLTATISTATGKPVERRLTLAPGAGGQHRAFPVEGVTAVRFTIESAHGASETKQVAVAEIEFFGRPVSEDIPPPL
ncbi:serine/threonine-protein kinase [Streptomyces sp. NPDC057638]|uniref:serine/threonine-protein kinase n=1 Tax=Streptomyces sp. NPDC057638 TaxID=3346190 RepID=UPI0036DD75EB